MKKSLFKKQVFNYFKIIFLLPFLFSSCNTGHTEKNEWISLFNGTDLDDWIIKFNHSGLNENYRNTFRVEDSMLVVDYSEYDTITNEFGHIYYKQAFSHYKLRVEYRFVGEQAPGGAGWAYRNNGVMFHCQDPKSILKDQAFPVSIEAQLLGADEGTERPTGNVCTPGTHIVMNDELITQHCINSNSQTYAGDQWVEFELVVYGDSIIHHIVEGDTVMTYSKPQIGGDLPEGFDLPVGFALTEGYIALQAESHPTQFKTIELMELK
jgi:hypothetical protein